ncbi:antitoxin VbhA family protein (plasmid) [Megamonas funiformis]|uniref:Antitoxin VbhA domain-containing protein n=1 Tax=Megamonas funiformis YIT 11815 TaxID=742816 RepID=A0ABP2NGF4_9FIRM|nr:antitoxin VbhA family protein [Megamonas funiformis]EHR31899.1 hypothetical protein HMPREF9454_02462 [Megamonas funiformis YIT 11815]QIB61287.1 antitoxin VbhA family protein [Megamonas funiformis]
MTNNNLKKNVISAIKSCELEGFVYTKEEKQVFNRIASGEITVDEARKIFKRMS